jgi:hypothetical protein
MDTVWLIEAVTCPASDSRLRSSRQASVELVRPALASSGRHRRESLLHKITDDSSRPSALKTHEF